MIPKLAIFDFCETLVNFQTADAFVDFVRNHEGKTSMKLLEIISTSIIKTRVDLVINKVFPKKSFLKKFKLFQLRGIEYKKLNGLAELFYLERIKPNLIPRMMIELMTLKELGFEICIASGGYSIYLEHFARDFDIKFLIANDISFKNPEKGYTCTGKLIGNDCYNTEKAIRVKNFFRDQNVDFKASVSYSDSKSDLPILLLTGKGVVVSRNHTQNWKCENNLKEIIWS